MLSEFKVFKHRHTVNGDSFGTGIPKVHGGEQFPLSDPCTKFIAHSFIWTYTLLLSIPPILGWGTFHESILLVR